ncbi:MAG: holo-ACP synthase [Pseudomonadota bacterium]
MIIGIGSDIIKIARIEALLLYKKEPFLSKIFTSKEMSLLDKIKHPKRLAGYVAKRFAAKEAFSKALGTGIGEYVSFKDIEIFSEESKKPFFVFSKKLDKFLHDKYGSSVAHLSITDEGHYAQAFVIIEKL